MFVNSIRFASLLNEKPTYRPKVSIWDAVIKPKLPQGSEHLTQQQITEFEATKDWLNTVKKKYYLLLILT